MKNLLFLFVAGFISISFAQNKISGIVLNTKNMPIAQANIYIQGTYDGASTNDKGEFIFETNETGNKVLVVTCLTYVSQNINITIPQKEKLTIILKESVNTLDAVVINVGSFDSGEKAKVIALKPLDIVTTAGANGNIVSALQTLPGTSNVGESGRLFVRGGEADETQTFVDGIRVAQPYGASAQNVPTRGRFSPFLFSGMSFSTGGYSAEYGEALSSVLLLNTTDDAVQEKTDISLMTVGLGLANTQKWKKNSLSVNAAYINLAPYQALIPQNLNWKKPYETLSGEMVYRHHIKTGLFKFYAAFDATRFNLEQISINAPYTTEVDMRNNNFYTNASYKVNLGNRWNFFSGLSLGLGENKTGLNLDNLGNNEVASHLKLRLRKTFSDKVKLTLGSDYFITNFKENFNQYQVADYNYGYKANIFASYAETDIFFTKNIGMTLGLRYSNNNYLNTNTLSPRFSLGYKINKNNQFSLSYGLFEQSPKQDYIKFTNALNNEKAAHYILNYQFTKNKQTLKLAAYFKDYSNLIKYDTNLPTYNAHYNNNGTGFAQGLDVFWRDNKNIKNLEYWVSYSYLDTQRDYRNYTDKVTPGFAAAHTLSVVTKYWIAKWRSQVGFSHTYTSGRPYNNPNETQFMHSKTKDYNSLSINWAYLVSQQKILYFSVTNVLGTQNVYGYEYANSPDSSGVYNRRAIMPTADRFFFVGFFWTISDNKKENQLENL